MTTLKKAKKWVEDHGMTLTELAKKVGISKELLSHYLNPPPEGSRLKIARKISKVTDGEISVRDFYPQK